MEGAGRSEYRSVAKGAKAELVEKRSRFLAFVEPASTVSEAELLLQRVREAHPGASHVTFAYRVGIDSPVVRMNDDREPQGTAGRPVLEVLEKNGLDNVVAGVVRYFGGTLLGAAGLTRAYARAAALAVAEAGIARYILHARFRSRFAYADWPRIERLFERSNVRIESIMYLEEVEVAWAVPKDLEMEVRDEVARATGGRGRADAVGEGYFAR